MTREELESEAKKLETSAKINAQTANKQYKQAKQIRQQLAALDKPKRAVIVNESADGDFDLAKCTRRELTLDQALVERVATATGIPFLYVRDAIKEIFGVGISE